MLYKVFGFRDCSTDICIVLRHLFCLCVMFFFPEKFHVCRLTEFEDVRNDVCMYGEEELCTQCF
jgi:hypothetical protein